jgi:hypothetical protein
MGLATTMPVTGKAARMGQDKVTLGSRKEGLDAHGTKEEKELFHRQKLHVKRTEGRKVVFQL